MNRRIIPSELQRIDVYDPDLPSGRGLVRSSEISVSSPRDGTAQGDPAESRRSKGGR